MAKRRAHRPFWRDGRAGRYNLGNRGSSLGSESSEPVAVAAGVDLRNSGSKPLPAAYERTGGKRAFISRVLTRQRKWFNGSPIEDPCGHGCAPAVSIPGVAQGL